MLKEDVATRLSTLVAIIFTDIINRSTIYTMRSLGERLVNLRTVCFNNFAPAYLIQLCTLANFGYRRYMRPRDVSWLPRD